MSSQNLLIFNFFLRLSKVWELGIGNSSPQWDVAHFLRELLYFPKVEGDASKINSISSSFSK
ncbi:MAG: hypothetical protein F6K47_00125 [Symploca sp. SIO2E6]|nr:hypothetical protein [Symploca sp. SIO2E6]